MLPPYDVLQYEQELGEIQRLLAGRGGRQRAFRFRRPAAGEQPPEGAPQPAATERAAAGAARFVAAPSSPAAPAATAPPTTGATLRGFPVQGTLALQRLDGCLVDVRSAAVPAAHLCDLQNTVVLVGSITSSLFLERCTRCAVVAACGQCRVYASEHVALLLDTSSAVTLERCVEVAVAPARGGAPLHVQDFDVALGGTARWRAMPPEEGARLAAQLARCEDAASVREVVAAL